MRGQGAAGHLLPCLSGLEGARPERSSRRAVPRRPRAGDDLHGTGGAAMPRPVEPRPLKQRRLKTIFLRVPTWAWAMVSTGRVSEFRAAVGNVPQLGRAPLPTPAVIYRPRLKVGE